MKTTFFKIAMLLLIISVGNSRSFAANRGKTEEYTELNWISNFSKIEVHGNVQLHLLSGEKNKVEMNSTYYDHNALVQVENGVLRITCFKTERLNVWVTVNDLSALWAYDNVLVQSEGKFSALEFDLELFNTAKAELNLDCCTANIKLNDRAMADISGSAIEGELITNYAATLNSSNFIAAELSVKRTAPVWETRIEFIRPQYAASQINIIDDSQELSDDTKKVRFSSSSSTPIKLDIPTSVKHINITCSLIN